MGIEARALSLVGYDEDEGEADAAPSPPARPAVPHAVAQRQAALGARLFRDAPDPDRGWALAALTGELSFDAAKPAAIRKAVESADGSASCSPGPTTMSAIWPRPWR